MKKIILLGVCIVLLATLVLADQMRLDLENLNGNEAEVKTTFNVRENRDGTHRVSIQARMSNLDVKPGIIYEGWLIDVETDTKQSIGAFAARSNGKALMRFSQNFVNFKIFDKIVITEEYKNDIDPTPGSPILEADIPGSIGTTVTLLAELDARQETDRSRSRAKGEGEFTLYTENNTVVYHITRDEFKTNETGAHIHGFADKGENAGVLHVLPNATTKWGAWVFTNESTQAKIIAGLTYVNIHSEEYAPGEIRGQIVVS